MPAQLELQANASVFTVIAEVKLSERPSRREETNETQLAVLAYELARYMPALAGQLASAGRERLLAA
ncbi:MAG: hypothetical protein IPK32_10050 [Verrucomicrobiaceae bacterium]|nr:hypothetical protein [Verrucomicrobiaceae bacterium]